MTTKLKPIICTGPKDGRLRTFFLETESASTSHSPSIKLFVHLTDPPNPGVDDFFYAEFQCIGPDEVQSVSLDNQGKDHYRGKGITEALFSEVVRMTGRRLVSSSNKASRCPNEFRTTAATRVWERLISNGRAAYDHSTDRYTYIP